MILCLYLFQCFCLCRHRCPTETCDNIFNHPKDVKKTMKCRKCNKNIALGNSVELLRKVEDIYDSAARCLEVRVERQVIQNIRYN
jgi:hypothetical protein